MRRTNNKQLITDNGGRESPPSEVISYVLSVISSRSGQSLIEVVIGLAIGSILIGASAFAISTMLQTNLASQKGQVATSLAQELLNKARVYGSADWQSLYSLTKASSTQYFLNASGTTYVVIPGKEGSLDNDVTNGLAAEWKFDEDASTTSTLTYDATGNGNNGTLSNVTRATSTCKMANCARFNGTNSFVSVNNSTSLNPTSTITISAWIRPTDITTLSYVEIMRQESGASRKLFSFQINGTQLTLGLNTAGAYWETDFPITPSYFTDGNWHHVLYTYDGSFARLYVDGTLNNSQTHTGAIAVSGANLYIGSTGGGSEFYKGDMDDVRIYNRALSADEVRQLWNSNIFTRYFYVENVCRTNNASSSISGVAPCGSGSADDPSSQKITAVTQWVTGQGAGFTSLSDYLTRWKNTIFRQTDWSGGSGATSPVTSPGSTFTSSTGANFSGGSIRIQGL